MHELSLCEGILQVLERESRTRGFQRVKNVWLEIGRLAGVEVDAMRFSFDVVVRDTLADGAGLEIIELPGTAWCPDCAETIELGQRFEACPRCGSHRVEITGGNEMRIKQLEVV